VVRVAVVGAPNAGKSTLVNALVRSLVTAVSRKTNTTRGEALGALTEGDTQLLLYDTPGVVGPASWRGSAHAQRVASAWRTAADADVVLFVVDAARQAASGDPRVPLLLRRAGEELGAAAERGGRGAAGLGLRPAAAAAPGADAPPLSLPPALLVLNKADALAGPPLPELRALLADLSACHDFAACHAVSALRRSGVAALRRALLARAVPGRWPLPPQRVAERGAAAQALAATSSALFERLHDELPYSIQVRHAGWEEFRDGSVRIEHTLLVPSDAVRRIVVGAGGAAVGQMGIAARRALEKAFGRRVHLILNVKVSKGRRALLEEGADGVAAETYREVVRRSAEARAAERQERGEAAGLQS